VALRDLERDATSARELYESFLQRLREVNEVQNLQQADAVVLSAAVLPVDPYWPDKKLIVLLAFGAACLVGAVLVFLLERWDNGFGFRSAEEVVASSGLRALALVPDLTRRETRELTPEEYILKKPQSAFAEALQRVRTSIFLADRDRSTRSVLVTSSVPVEGKSLISAAMARQSARSGLRTLLIDADLRRPRLHEVFRVANNNGLADLLYGDLMMSQAIRTDEKSGLRFIPAGLAPVSPPDLFRGDAMRRLLKEVTRDYDLVIIDSPPVGAVSDSLILSGLVDKTLYVVRWQQTPRNVANAGIRQIQEAGGDLAGVVLSRVDVKKHAQYGYADSGSYAGTYGKYFVN
jgi:capsular exopolysaccharide synthesis family protein